MKDGNNILEWSTEKCRMFVVRYHVVFLVRPDLIFLDKFIKKNFPSFMCTVTDDLVFPSVVRDSGTDPSSPSCALCLTIVLFHLDINQKMFDDDCKFLIEYVMHIRTSFM